MPTRSASCPHPILGSGDDIRGVFTSGSPAVEVRRSTTLISLGGITCTNETLLELINQGQADYSLQIDCGATFFRELHRQRQPDFHLELSTGDLLGTVDMVLRIRATRAIAGYQPADLNEEYGSATFDVEAGAILAEGPRFSFEVPDEFEAPDPNAGSLIRVKVTDEADAPLRFDFTDSNRIYILLSKTEFQSYLSVQNSLPGIIHSSLVFPCVIRAIEQVRKDETESGESSAGWRKKLRTILERDGVMDAEPEVAAAIILKRPFWRAATQMLGRLANDDA